MRRPLSLALLLASLPRVAVAQAPDVRAFEARRACAAGDTQKGVELLADYFAETGDTIAIFNQGRCYQQNDVPDKALSRFREYLRATRKPPPERRAEAERHIAELEQELHRRQTPTPTPTPASAPASAPVPAPAPAPAPVPAPASHLETNHPPPQNSTLRLASTILAATALAAAGTGAFFTVRVASHTRTAEAFGQQGRPPVSEAEARHTIDAGNQAQTLQYVGYGAAGALAGSAIVLFLLSRRSEPAVAAVPMVGPTTAGGSLRLTF